MNLKFWKNIKIRSNTSALEKLTFATAECCGTAMYLFIGCLGSAYSRPNFTMKHIESSITFGLGVLVAVQCFGHISGAHVNPILSLSAILIGRLSLVDGLFYFIGQFVGAFIGYGFLILGLTKIYTTGTDGDRELPGFCVGVIRGVKETNALFVEFIASIIFVLVFCGLLDYRNSSKSDSIGLTLSSSLLGLSIACARFTGCHVNPARTLAPAVINNYWKHHHVYWCGSILGAVVGSLLYAILFLKVEDDKETQDPEEKEK